MLAAIFNVVGAFAIIVAIPQFLEELGSFACGFE
jgi:hypothetical protein